jgi:hypothetical protein
MANQWLRLWHDMPNDPKWRTIARISKQPLVLVKAIYLHLLVDASTSPDRGTARMCAEDLGSALDADDAAVQAVLDAMQGRVLDCMKLTGWEQRQPASEQGCSEGGGRSAGSNYVYYVGTTDSDVVKVGISRNPWSRVKDLQTGSAHKFELLTILKTDSRSEFGIHKFFAKTRLNGEWFSRCNALNSLISKTKSKDLCTLDACISFLESLPPEDYEPTMDDYRRDVVATKDKEEDKDKNKDKNNKPMASSQAPTLDATDCQTLKTGKTPAKKWAPDQIELPNWLPPASWADWIAHRKHIRAPLTARSATLSIQELTKLKTLGNDPIAVIEQSVMSGKWTGLFPLKTDQAGGSRPGKFDPVAYVNRNQTERSDHDRNRTIDI